jgi:hypothetical protein
MSNATASIQDLVSQGRLSPTQAASVLQLKDDVARAATRRSMWKHPLAAIALVFTTVVLTILGLQRQQ